MDTPDRPAPRITPKIVAGAILILLGVLFTLDNFGLLDAGDLFDYWPMILVGIGLAKVLQPKSSSDRSGGFVLLAIGVLFQGAQLGFWSFRLRSLWPLVLLAAGAALIWQSLARRRAREEMGLPENPGERALLGARAGLGVTHGLRTPVEVGARLDEFAVLGGGDRIVSSSDFVGGEVVAIMAGFQIDLRGAAIAGETAVIEVFTLWGGIDFRVPEDWDVVVQGTPILGVFTSSARPAGKAEGPRPRLVIKGVAVMGGVEIKN